MSEDKRKSTDYAAMERPIFEAWKDAGYFQRTPGFGEHAGESYTIVIPPPNITGVLHMGHALNDTIQDACIRRARMRGFQTRWIIGTDHAGISTQTKVDKRLAEQGISRLEIGREAFIEECYKWREEYGTTIVNQIKGMGCSCDYSDEHFTLEPAYVRAVRKLFTDWFHEDIIYRGKRIVNWCPHCTTAIADDEAEYVDEAGHLWYLRYPLTEPVCGLEYLVVATTRPETMLGDTGVAVNPKDERFGHLVGKTVKLPLVDREIPIFADWHVDTEFGTGCVKVTPSHDPNDWAMGERAGLERINIFDETAHVVEGYGKFSGMDRDEAREAIVAAFEELGLLDHVEDHDHSVMTCYRCHTKLEPWESEQWFVAVDALKEPAARVVEDGSIQFHPARWKQVYLDWLANLKDWCISRQLWWGHQIPAWYCADCGAATVAKSAPAACPHCGSTNLTQDPDTLDTWFSSALWPFSTLGWPNENAEDYNYFYPTNTLVTGYDIIGFWVSRMIFSGLAYTGKAPFDTVLIHGIVRDSQGRKMSKSLGNGIDPLKVIDEYGADALRMMLMVGSTAGNDMRYSDEKVTASRNFANKLWNASRFVQMNLPEDFEPGMPAEELLDMSDKWVLSELARTAAEVTANLDKYELGLAAEKVENFIWDIYCDWYIEICKSRLNGEEAQQADTARKVLVWVLDKALKLLHPFMPFITEEIYQALPGSAETIMTQEWPDAGKMTAWPQECADFEVLMDYIKAVRTIRNDMNVHPAKKTSMTIETANPAAFQKGGAYLARFAFATDVALTEKYTGTTDGVVTVVTPAARGFIPMMELIDREKELKRLHKELEKAEKEANMFRNQLNNPKFVERAPEKLVNETRTKLAASEDKIANINQSIQALG